VLIKLKYLLSFEAVLSKDENSLRLSIVAQDVISSEENSMEILKEFETALSEITTNTNITYLNTGVPAREPILNSPQHHYPEINGTGRLGASEINFKWSDSAYSIRDEISLLAGCEATALDAQTSIFALGLDSIDAIKLSSRLKRRAIEISVSTIMRNGTIYQLTQASKSFHTGTDQRPKLQLRTYEAQLSAYLQRNGFPIGSIEGVLPPTPLQEAIFADTSTTVFSRYLNQEIFIIRSAVDLRKLELAWKSVIDQSPILRTCCVAVDDPEIPFSYAQVIHRPGLSSIHHVSVPPNDDIDTVIENVMKHDRTISLDSVPFALTFVHDLDKSHLVLTLSHALYDGISLSMLHTDIVDAYHDRFSSRPSCRDTLEHILNSSDARASHYWIGYIQGAKPCSFLSDVQKSVSYSRVNRLERCSSVPATDMRTFAKSQGISVQAIGQVCWALLVGHYLQTLEVVFGVILSGRDTEQSNEVMLPTMNTVVVRSVIGGSLGQMLQDMQAHCANAIQHQHFPLRKTLAAVKNGSQKLFDSLFLVQRKSAVIANNEQLYESTGGKSSVEVTRSAHQ
jgi:ferricrocin synthase